MTATGARRLHVPAGEMRALCSRLGLRLPPGLVAPREGIRTEGLLGEDEVHPSLAAGLLATCSPQLGVLIASTLGDLHAAFGLRVDLGGSMARAGNSAVEVAAWPAHRLGAELARVVPALERRSSTPLHLPLDDLCRLAELTTCLGTLRATVVAPPTVVGSVVWLATASGWLSLEPATVEDGRRWVTARPVEAQDIGGCVAPYVAAALS